MKGRIAFITGAVSGIGKATTMEFAKNGYNLILLDISREKLDEFAKFLHKKFHVQTYTLAIDIRDRQALIENVKSLPKPWQKVSVLVNSAGVALGRCAIQDGDPNDWDTMIDVNIKGMLNVFKAIVPLMMNVKNSHIINLGSITGKEIYPTGSVYSMTKHAVNALSGCMRVDLLPYRIKVTVINPGRVETNLAMVRYKGDKEKAKKDYEGFTPLKPEDVARAIFFAASQPDHVDIYDIIITPADQGGANLICKQEC